MTEDQSSVVAPIVEYRLVPDFPGYRVGDDGSVWSCWTKVYLKGDCGRHAGTRQELGTVWHQLKTGLSDPSGRRNVGLHRGGRSYTRLVHRLVALAFLGPCPKSLEVCHYDGNPANNKLDNLRYDTRKANYADSVRHGTQTKLKGERHGMSKLNDDKIRAIRLRIAAGDTHQEISDQFHVCRALISLIASRKRWGHVI